MDLSALSDAALDQAITNAHTAQDGGALTALYREAARRTEAHGATDAACFLLTQAYVFALESGDTQAEDIHRQLVAQGREE